MHKRPDRDYQYDFSERYVVKKEKVSRNEHLGKERDNFSCPRGNMFFYDQPSLDFGVQMEEYRLARQFRKYNRRCSHIYGEEM
jgi:hypothetical protein